MTQSEERQREAGLKAGEVAGRSQGYISALEQIASTVAGLRQQVVGRPTTDHLLTMEVHENKTDRIFNVRIYYEGQLICDETSLDVSGCFHYGGQAVKAHMEKIGRHHKDWDD